jgi:tetratricopeptide (TPR) repeat protein
MVLRRALVSLASLVLVACGAAPQTAPQTPQTPPKVDVPTQIVGPSAEGTAKELMEKGERAILAQKWRDAADAFETLLAAEPKGPHTEDALYGLATAYEGLELREKAKATYEDLVKRFPDSTRTRAALVREAQLAAYLEDWPALGQIGDALLARKDADDVDRMTGLGARGLSKIEAGDDVGASRDVQNGLDLVDSLKYGMTGRLPAPAAQLRFALGEIRRVRSERISFLPVSDDFLSKINARASGLMAAQSSYADAIRSVDLHWAAMSGYRIGEMYRSLHKDLMTIPPQNAKGDKDKQLFFGMMHVRYRVLLEKGVEMLKRTLTISEAGQDSSTWIKRAEKAKAEMELALEEEKAQLKKFPFTEEELQRALELLEKKSTAKASPAK